MFLPTVIDNRARLEPDRLFCVLTKSDKEAEITNSMVSYGDYANSINKCAWWIEETLGKGSDLDTLGYLGPPDFRYTIVALAAAKTN